MCSVSPASGPACDEELEQRFESSTQRGGVGCDERVAGADVAHELYRREEQPPQRFPAQMRWPPVLPAADRPVFADQQQVDEPTPSGLLEDPSRRRPHSRCRRCNQTRVKPQQSRNDHTGGAGSVRDIGRRAVLPAQQGFDPAAQHEIRLVHEQLGSLLNTHQPRMLRARHQPRRVILGAQRTPLGVTANAPGSAPYDRSGAWSTIRSTRSSAPLENLRCNYRSATRMAGLHWQVGCSPPTPVEPIWACQARERR
jgi:hypothetical protein